MRLFYSFTLLFICFYTHAQSVDVAGQCINSTTSLSNAGTLDGKSYYEGFGTVDGNPGVQIDIYWSSADNLWLLAFDGQPYFQNSCDFSGPPGTGATCAWTAVSGMTCTGGSALSITGNDVVLPVHLYRFTATAIHNTVVLDWKTSLEINNKNYEVQRSGDGTNWTTIGNVKGAGNSSTGQSYQFTDYTPLTGKNYYRLIQHDADGHLSYLKTVSIDFSLPDRTYFALAGNPGNGSYKVNIFTQRPVELKVTDLSGKILISKLAIRGANLIDISTYPSGVYLLQLNKDNQTTTQKLIKQ